MATPKTSGASALDNGDVTASADGDVEQDEVAAFVHKQPPAQAGG